MPKLEVERKVLNFLREIPAGKVTTYKEIAKRFKLHPRVVGIIMSRNEHPELFPCFKVIRSNGELGGYSGADGVRSKARLLRRDGVKFEKRIDLSRYLWS